MPLGQPKIERRENGVFGERAAGHGRGTSNPAAPQPGDRVTERVTCASR
jgi:hypothetical protein